MHGTFTTHSILCFPRPKQFYFLILINHILINFLNIQKWHWRSWFFRNRKLEVVLINKLVILFTNWYMKLYRLFWNCYINNFIKEVCYFLFYFSCRFYTVFFWARIHLDVYKFAINSYIFNLSFDKLDHHLFI